METPKFRSVEEIKRWVGDQREQFNEDRLVIDQMLKRLTAACSVKVKAAELKFLDISKKGSGALRKRTLNLEFPIVKVPNASQLQNHYAVAEKLSEQYKFILNAENEIRLNFKGATVKNATSESYAEVSGAIQKLKEDLRTTLEKVFHSLAQIADGHAPKEFKHMMEILTETLSKTETLAAESAKSFTYAALDKAGQLVFGGYILLENAVNDQGKVQPSLYIVLKWTVGEDVEVFVEPEFVAPTLLHGGTVVENMREITLAVERQLTLEGFSSQLGQLPVSVQLRLPNEDDLRNIFSAKDYIKTVRAEPQELIFEMKTSDREVIDQIVPQIYAEVKAMVRKKRSTTVRYSVKGPVVTFTFSNLDHGGGLHPQDLEFLQDKYGLNPSQMRKIVNVVNG
jgi:hypothetical protein